jgi:hypothetical protein
VIFAIPPLLFAGASYALVRGLFLDYPKASIDGELLSRKEQAIVAACADAFFPAGGPIPISGTEAGLVAYFDAYAARLPKGQGLLVRLLLWFIEHGPWVFGPRAKRFTKMRHDERLAVLASMQKSPIYFRRVAFLSMRTMLTMGYLAHPDVCRAMHLVHDPDPFRASAREVVAPLEQAS